MNFVVSTKPLTDALNLGIINANVSKFHRTSCLAQVTMEGDTLRINLEAPAVVSQLKLKGSGEKGKKETIFVDNLLLKQLVATLETSTVTLEISEDGLTIHSGKSKFTLPRVVDENDAPDLNAPQLPEYTSNPEKIDKEAWKFIDDHQMYAIGMSFVRPIYTKVWVGENGDVIIGDFDNSNFTHSKKSNLGKTCVLVSNIINLFTSLPDDATIGQVGRGYIVSASTDAFDYLAEIIPEYEEDENTGSYNSDIILRMMDHSKLEGCKVKASALNKLLSQAAILASGTEETIHLSIKSGFLSLYDRNIDGKVEVNAPEGMEFDVEFRSKLLKPFIANYEDEEIYLAPYIGDEGEINGVIVWTDDLTSILAVADNIGV